MLIVFSAFVGISDIGFALDEMFMRQVQLPSGTYNLRSVRGEIFFEYLYYVSVLQNWVFAIRYFSSAVQSSAAKTLKFDPKTIRMVALVGSGLYIGVQTILTIILLVSFPGYFDDGGSFL